MAGLGFRSFNTVIGAILSEFASHFRDPPSSAMMAFHLPPA
jgi:hypothetical protein